MGPEVGDFRHNLITPKVLLGWELPVNARPEEALKTLVEQLRKTQVHWPALESLVSFDRGGYRRRVLFRSPGYEMVLACWLPGQGTLAHDHGGSSGATRVILGRIWETWFERSPQGMTPKGERPVREGGVMVELPSTIHRVENRSSRGAISLHIYTPPLSAMPTWKEETAVSGGADAGWTVEG